MTYLYQHIDDIDYEKYKGGGLTGLVNLGNTCFMNACLQCLSHTYPLRELLTNETFINEKIKNTNETILLKEWVNLNNLMWSKNCTVSCDRWIDCVQITAKKQGKHLFTGFEQNDCSEFLMFVLENFHESIKREVKMIINGKPINDKDKIAVKCYKKIKEMYEKEYSELINIFFGVQMTRIRSATCNSKVYTEKPEPFFMINASIPTTANQSFTIKDCFDMSSSKELLEGDNAWYNEETKQKEDVYIENSYWNLPNILIICLKRFNNYGRKVNKVLMIEDESLDKENYSLYIDLSNYVEDHHASTYKYEVYGFCIHIGSIRGGHYVSVVKTANNQWYLFDDQRVKKIEKPQEQISKLYESSYCLFMKKI